MNACEETRTMPASRRAYVAPAVSSVRVRTVTRQLARVSASEHCTAHIHNDNVAVDPVTCCQFS